MPGRGLKLVQQRSLDPSERYRPTNRALKRSFARSPAIATFSTNRGPGMTDAEVARLLYPSMTAARDQATAGIRRAAAPQRSDPVDYVVPDTRPVQRGKNQALALEVHEAEIDRRELNVTQSGRD